VQFSFNNCSLRGLFSFNSKILMEWANIFLLSVQIIKLGLDRIFFSNTNGREIGLLMVKNYRQFHHLIIIRLSICWIQELTF